MKYGQYVNRFGENISLSVGVTLIGLLNHVDYVHALDASHEVKQASAD